MHRPSDSTRVVVVVAEREDRVVEVGIKSALQPLAGIFTPNEDAHIVAQASAAAEGIPIGCPVIDPVEPIDEERDFRRKITHVAPEREEGTQPCRAP